MQSISSMKGLQAKFPPLWRLDMGVAVVVSTVGSRDGRDNLISSIEYFYAALWETNKWLGSEQGRNMLGEHTAQAKFSLLRLLVPFQVLHQRLASLALVMQEP